MRPTNRKTPLSFAYRVLIPLQNLASGPLERSVPFVTSPFCIISVPAFQMAQGVHTEWACSATANLESPIGDP